VIHRMRVLEADAGRIVIETQNVSPVRAFLVTLFPPGSLRAAYPTPDYAKNQYRSINPEFLVVIGICTHLGCSPTDKLQAGADSGMGDDWKGGFYCPCHGSKFDLAGRVFRDMPAPTNLEVPKYQFVSETQLVIGDDGKGA